MTDQNKRLMILAARGPNATEIDQMMPLIAKALQVVGYYSVYWRELSHEGASKAIIAIEEEDGR